MSEHLCEVCEEPVERTNGRGRWPKRCAGCRGEAKETESGPDSLAVVDSFALDYNLGSAVRFILNRHDDSDEKGSLETARIYLDRAIARL